MKTLVKRLYINRVSHQKSTSIFRRWVISNCCFLKYWKNLQAITTNKKYIRCTKPKQDKLEADRKNCNWKRRNILIFTSKTFQQVVVTISNDGVESFELTRYLQVGQDEWATSHLSMQPTWNRWLHLGNTLIFSPSEKSAKQMAQPKSDKAELWPEVATVKVGKATMSFFLRPEFNRRAEAHSTGSVRARWAHR